MYTPDKPPTGKRTRKTNVKSEQHERSGGSYNMEDKKIYQCQNDLSRGPIPDIVLRHLQQDRFRMVFVAEDSGAGDTNSVEMRHIKVMILMRLVKCKPFQCFVLLDYFERNIVAILKF